MDGGGVDVDGRRGSWGVRIGVVAAVVVVAGAVIALASGRGDGTPSESPDPAAGAAPTTGGPDTTARRRAPARPGTTVPPATDVVIVPPPDGPDTDLPVDQDPRVMLTDLPAGYTARHATWIDSFSDTYEGALLFVGESATWGDGPWVLVDPGRRARFVGPTTTIDVGGAEARAGRSGDGADLVVVVGADRGPSVSAKGLPPGTAAAVAAAVRSSPGDGWSLPAAALPAGLRPAPDSLSRSSTATTASSVVYLTERGVSVSVFASLAGSRPDPREAAGFYLDDIAYVDIGGDPGVIGTFVYDAGTAQSVQWRHGGIDIEITASGVERTELLELAARARTRADGGWTERDWELATGMPEGIAWPSVEIATGVPLDGRGSLDVFARRTGAQLSWWASGSGQTVSGFGVRDDPGATVFLDVAATSRDAISDEPSHVIAIALGDESAAGATLRVRTGAAVDGTGTTGAEHGGRLGPLAGPTPPTPAGTTTGTTAPRGGGSGDGTAVPAPDGTTPRSGPDTAAPAPDATEAGNDLGYAYGTAVAAAWVEGSFVVELVAADGVTVLATATEADLP